MENESKQIKFDELIDFSNKENSLIYYFKYNISEYYETSLNALRLTKCIKSIESKGYIFFHFFNHASNSFHLSIISTLRKHAVQANMMLRQALESSVLAAYSISNTKPEDFGELEDGEFLNPIEKVKIDAYKWIKNNYKSYSDYIKESKDEINKLFSHSNIVITETNIKIQENKISALKFDSEADELIMGELLGLSKIIFYILNMSYEINKKYKMIIFVDDFESSLSTLHKNLEVLEKKLLNDPVYKKFLDEMNHNS